MLYFFPSGIKGIKKSSKYILNTVIIALTSTPFFMILRFSLPMGFVLIPKMKNI